MIRGIDHIELIVRDFDEYIEFLKTLGMKVLTHTTHHGESAELQAPGENQPIFEIHQATGEEVIGVTATPGGSDASGQDLMIAGIWTRCL